MGDKGARDRASTSAVEWPTLREAAMVKRTRKERTSQIDQENEFEICDGVTDWFM